MIHALSQIPLPFTASSLSFSPSNRMIAAGDPHGRVGVFSIQGWQASMWVAKQQAWHPDEIYALAWSPDGNYLAASGLGQDIAVWNQKGHPFSVWQAHRDTAIVDLSWSPDGCFLASTGNDGMLRVWNIGTTPFQEISTYDHHVYVGAVAWSPTGNLIASGNSLGEIVLSDPQTGRKHKKYMGALSDDPDNLEMQEINGLAWSPDGNYLAATQTAVGGNSGLLQLFSLHGSRQPIAMYAPEPPLGRGWLHHGLWMQNTTLLAADMNNCVHHIRYSSGQFVSMEHRFLPAIGAICLLSEDTFITASASHPHLITYRWNS